MANEYNLGQGIDLDAEFYVDNLPTDPTTLTLSIERPSGVVNEYIYDPQTGVIVKVSDGVFTAAIIGDESGYWDWRWEGTGAAQAVVEGSFFVRLPLVPVLEAE